MEGAADRTAALGSSPDCALSFAALKVEASIRLGLARGRVSGWHPLPSRSLVLRIECPGRTADYVIGHRAAAGGLPVAGEGAVELALS